jgi:hypothetical protein
MSSYGRNNEGAPLFFWVAAVFLAVLAMIVWKFSEFTNLDFSTGAEVFFFNAVVISMLFGSWWLGLGYDYEFLGWHNTAPALVALWWAAWWPAFNHWATPVSLGAAGEASYGFNPWGESIPWWDTWYFLAGVFLAILAVGYGIRRWWLRRH